MPPDPVLALQASAGNRAVAQLLQAERAQVARVLQPLQQQAILAATPPLSTALDAAMNQIPQGMLTAATVKEHPVMEEISAITQEAKTNGPDATNANLQQRIVAAQAKVNVFAAYVNTHQAVLQEIKNLLRVFAKEEGKEMDDDLTHISDRFIRGKATGLELNRFVRDYQREVIPQSRAIDELRAKNADAAITKVGRLVDAGLIRIGKHMAFYKSSYDWEKDGFGASWELETSAESGAMQWVREWEFHVHAKAKRPPQAAVAPAPAAAPAPRPITGFEIKVGQVKHSKDSRALGGSVEIRSTATLNSVIQATLPMFMAWAATPEGLKVLQVSKY